MKKQNLYTLSFYMQVLLAMIIFLPYQSNAQSNFALLQGKVSFKTGQSIYVKFVSTSGIENGDTLFVKTDENLKAVLKVKHHSSISCLCNYISDIEVQIDDKIFASIILPEKQIIPTIAVDKEEETELNEQVLKSSYQRKPHSLKQEINGKLTLSSYTNTYNSNDYSQRFRYRLSLKGSNLSNSKISFESYISFTHKLNEWDLVKENFNKALKIYNLSINYKLTENTNIWIGRKTNPNIANVGAIDGLQFQHYFGNFYAGLAVGSRPDFQDYGINTSLFEVGGYIGHIIKTEIGQMQSSIAFFEQTNNSKTDRRFLYFQHSNSLIKNFRVFSSLELDLYKLENEKPKSTLSLTGLYASLYYRFSRKLSVSTSYDSRRNVIYYESYKDYAYITALEAARQGIRLRINYRPINYLNVGINAGTRFMKNDIRRTNTLNVHSTYTKIPFIDASLTASVNLMQTSYLNGEIYGTRLSKSFLKGKLNTMGNYRLVNFRYISTGNNLLQHIGELNLSWQQNKKLFLSVNFETTFQQSDNYTRIYFAIRKKF